MKEAQLQVKMIPQVKMLVEVRACDEESPFHVEIRKFERRLDLVGFGSCNASFSDEQLSLYYVDV